MNDIFFCHPVEDNEFPCIAKFGCVCYVPKVCGQSSSLPPGKGLGAARYRAKSHMWLYRTGNDEKEPIILYDYQPSRNGDHAVAFLKNFKGFVHSDGYRMPSAHLLLVEKTVYLPIHQKEQMYRLQYTVSRRLHKRIISKYIPICNIYCFTCQIQTGVIIQKNWIICRLL